jgi:hypothetical protein
MLMQNPPQQYIRGGPRSVETRSTAFTDRSICKIQNTSSYEPSCTTLMSHLEGSGGTIYMTHVPSAQKLV